MNFHLKNNILTCLNTLTAAGYEAFVVGGAVRDFLMQKTPHDYDIATNARPEEIKNLFEKTIPTGEKHGTITVILEDEPIEVTTYRCDGTYTDSRHPEDVVFKNKIQDDLSRRDFTVNAFAYHPHKGLIDLFDGQKDLENRMIRTVGTATMRFTEDALRILRAFRFASQLSFSIHAQTLAAAIQMAHLLKNISAERIGIEFNKLLAGNDPAIITPLVHCGALEFLGIPHTNFSLKILNDLPCYSQVRMAYLCLLTKADPETVCRNMKQSNTYIQSVLRLYTFFLSGPPISVLEMRKNFTKLPQEEWEIYFAACSVISPISQEIYDAYRQIIVEHLPCRITDLAITGHDLQSLGIYGQKIGQVLQRLLDIVLEQPHMNKKEKLLALAKEIQKTI